MTDARGVCQRRAETLSPAVPYVRGWAAASRGAEALAEQLRALSLDTDFPGLRADVNVSGDGVVQLGMVRPDAVQLLTCLLTAGLSEEIAQKLAAEDAGPLGENSSAA